jgi:MFS family permease
VNGSAGKRNISKLLAYAFFQMALVIMPIIVPFWQGEGLNLKEIFQLQGIFGFCLIAFDAPAGYVADLFGRKKTMVLGAIVVALGFQLLWFGHTFWDFALYEVLLGVGISLQSGCDVALLYATLETEKLTTPSRVLMGHRLMWQTIGEGSAALLGGALATVNLRWPIYANAVTACVPIFIALSIHEPQMARLDRASHLQNFKMIGRALFQHSRFLTRAIFNYIFYGFATYCAVWCFQPYWQARGWPIGSFGYLWAGICFAVAIVSRYAHKIETRIGWPASVTIIALAPIVGYLGMGLAGGVLGVVLSFAFPICRGLTQVLFQDAVNTRVPQEIRATTNSIGSLGTRFLFIVFGPILGYMLDHQGIDHAFMTMGLVYVIGAFAVALPLVLEIRRVAALS